MGWFNHQPANYLSRLHCGKPMQLGMSSNVSQVLRSTHILLQIGGPPWSFFRIGGKNAMKIQVLQYGSGDIDHMMLLLIYGPQHISSTLAVTNGSGFSRSHFESAKQSKVNTPEIEQNTC